MTLHLSIIIIVYIIYDFILHSYKDNSLTLIITSNAHT